MAFKRNTLPTMQQIRYLTELEEAGAETGFIMRIAGKCGVSHAAVSRYLKTCIENGILTEDYRFTEPGSAWLRSYQSMVGELGAYLRDAGLPEEEAEKNVRIMVEHMELHVILAIIQGVQGGSSISRKREPVSGDIMEPCKDCRVKFAFYRLEQGNEGNRFSMANRGFEDEAYLRRIGGEDYLELTTCEMRAVSRADGKERSGRVKTFKYHDDGILKEAEDTDGKVCLPLSACRLWQTETGEITALLYVTMTCTAGEEHMPESMALLAFWL